MMPSAAQLVPWAPEPSEQTMQSGFACHSHASDASGFTTLDLLEAQAHAYSVVLLSCTLLGEQCPALAGSGLMQ